MTDTHTDTQTHTLRIAQHRAAKTIKVGNVYLRSEVAGVVFFRKTVYVVVVVKKRRYICHYCQALSQLTFLQALYVISCSLNSFSLLLYKRVYF